MTLLFLTALSGVLAALRPRTAADPLVVSTTWLAEHLDDQHLILFHLGDRRLRPPHDPAHIAGAHVLAPLSEFSTPRVEGALVLELPSVETPDSVLESKGVSNDSHIVLYFARQYFSPTSRAVFTLEYMGLAGRVSILDGGLEAWKAEGRPVTAEVPAVSPGHFTPHPHPELVANADYVKGHLEDKAVRIVDARDTAFYNGHETRQGRNGHIPGAASLYFGRVVGSNGKFLSPAQLKAVFADAGVQPGQTVVTYCHIGQQASFVWFAARYLGYNAKLYDGPLHGRASPAALPGVNPTAPKPE